MSETKDNSETGESGVVGGVEIQEVIITPPEEPHSIIEGLVFDNSKGFNEKDYRKLCMAMKHNHQHIEQLKDDVAKAKSEKCNAKSMYKIRYLCPFVNEGCVHIEEKVAWEMLEPKWANGLGGEVMPFNFGSWSIAAQRTLPNIKYYVEHREEVCIDGAMIKDIWILNICKIQNGRCVECGLECLCGEDGDHSGSEDD